MMDEVGWDECVNLSCHSSAEVASLSWRLFDSAAVPGQGSDKVCFGSDHVGMVCGWDGDPKAIPTPRADRLFKKSLFSLFSVGGLLRDWHERPEGLDSHANGCVSISDASSVRVGRSARGREGEAGALRSMAILQCRRRHMTDN